MARGSYTTESTGSLPTPRTKLGVLEPRVYAWKQYGSKGNTSIKPGDFGCVSLAANLADVWLTLVSERGLVDSELHAAVIRFLRSIDTQLHAVDSVADLGLRDLRRRHLDAWETELQAEHEVANSDTAYRRAVHLFALLRRIEADAPGTLHGELLDRLETETRLWHHRNEGTPAFTDDEVRRIRGHAHRVVHAHNVKEIAEPTPEVLVALCVMLSLATGEPPEVLRSLTTGDIAATASADTDSATARLAHGDRLSWLAENELVAEFAVTYTKRRARETYQEAYPRRRHSAHRSLVRILAATASLRSESRHEALWLIRRANGATTEPPWNSERYSLSRFLADGGIHVNGKSHWNRLRKVVVAREAVADPTRYLRSRRRHTPETFFEHYTNSEVLRANAGRILVDAIGEKFTTAIQGPTVIPPDAEHLIANGVSATGLDRETSDALLRGDLDGPQTACRDPLDSPFADPGEVCHLSMTGTCFGCGNALITEHHLPAALVIAETANPENAADPDVWAGYWKPIYDTITKVVLPAFSDDTIERARLKMHRVPLDLGTRNDLRGTDED